MKSYLWIYELFLHLFPRKYHLEFRDEMLLTTMDTLMDAASHEKALVFSVWLSEIFDVVPNAMREHIRRITQMEIRFTDIKGKPEWYFYLFWVVLNGLTFPTAFFISFPIISGIERLVGTTLFVNGTERITEDYLLSWIILPLFTILTGLIQFIMLRDRIKKISNWFWLTALGWPVIVVAFGLLLAEFFRFINVTPPESLAFLYYGWIGLVLGVVQWLVLRKKFQYAWLWIAVSCLGWISVPIFIGISINNPLEMFTVPLIPALTTAIGLWVLFFFSPEPLGQNI